MATMNDIVTGACERLGIVSEDMALTAFQQQRGLARLNQLLQSLFARALAGVELQETVSQSMTIARSANLVFSNAASYTITMPENPDDGAMVHFVDAGAGFTSHPQVIKGNGRKVNGAAADYTLAVSNQSLTLLYRADLGDWRIVAASYIGTDAQPLNSSFDGALCDMLATDLVDVSGTVNDNALTFLAQRARRAKRVIESSLGARRRLRVDEGLLRTPGSTLRRGNVSAGLDR